MRREDQLEPVSATVIEQWPWALRAFLGCCTASFAVALTYSIVPLRAFPLLLAFPTVILTCWFLGMWGGVMCALVDAVLVYLFLNGAQVQLSGGAVREEVRLAMFFLVSILLGWAVRRLAQQRSLLATHELQQRLTNATVERKVAEERARTSEAMRDHDEVLQLALRTNGMGLWIWDLKKNDLHWSDEVYRIAGLEPGSIKPGVAAWLQFVHPDDADRVRQAVTLSQQGGLDYHQIYRVQWHDGSLHWVESKGRSQRDGAGKVTRVVGVLADITTRKQNEEAMLRAEKLAVAGRLAASVAHEINNPLEAVANLLYLITFAETATAAQEWAQQALDELMRVSLITQQTLKFHRQAGAPQSTKLSEVIQSIMALFRGRMRSAQIDVQLRVKGEEASIECMPGEVQQIFANLITNAIDAMPRGGRMVIRIRPSRDWRDRKTKGMRATLCDTGTGMDRPTLQRIFEPFFTTKAETGTGLGMWVVAQLADRHQGHVRVWSTQRAASGATAITVFLPLVNAAIPVPLRLP
jgi:PAS domain S-box-containing protein